MFFSGFLFILTHILLDLLSLDGAEAYIGWGGKLNCDFDGKLCQKYSYQKLIKSDNGLQVTVENVWDVFWDTV